MVLICISLMISHFEYLFIYWPSAYFLWRNILIYSSSLCILNYFFGVEFQGFSIYS